MNRQDAKNAKEEPDEELDTLAHRVIGAAIEVHRHLGPGFLESVYENAVAIEFRLAGVFFEEQQPVSVHYKGEAVGIAKVDFVVERTLLVELKAVDKILPIHKAQVISYLKATGLPLALLINFNERALRDGIHRIVLTH